MYWKIEMKREIPGVHVSGLPCITKTPLIAEYAYRCSAAYKVTILTEEEYILLVMSGEYEVNDIK